MRKKIQQIIHKKLIIITIVTQMLIVFGGVAMNIVSDIEEKNNQYFEYTETLRHLEEHLEQHGRSNFELNRAISRINMKSRSRDMDYYLDTIIE